MLKKSLLSIIASACALMSTSVFAVDFSFYPRIGTGFMGYEFDWNFSDRNIQIDDFSINDSVFLGIIGATLSVDRLYFDVEYKQSTEGEDERTTDFGNADQKYKVNNINLTVGYNFTDTLSFFAGFKDRETKLDEIANNNRPPSSGFFDSINYTFKSDGFYVGGAYGWPIGNNLLSIKLAYVRLQGNMAGDINSGSSVSSLKADDFTSNGFTAGVAWNGFIITNRLGYKVSLDAYNYDFDTPVEVFVDGNSIGQTDIKETSYVMKAELIYEF